MAENPEMTLNDFPNEIIERIVPDHKPKTISSLKLVSKRFYNFFSDDFYYKFYLHFPEKSYLCEMKCEKNSGKEIVEEIKSGAVGKWKGYLTLENVHLENWRNGRIAHTEFIPLPPLSNDFDSFNIDGVFWHEHIDEDNEHWLLSLREDGSIVLLNITDKPKMFVERELYGVATDSVRLISGQVVCISYNMGHIVVLDIGYDGDQISLQHNVDFDFDALDFSWIIVTGICGSTQSQTNLFVFIRTHPRVDGMLHFRDLKSGDDLEHTCLWDYELLKKYRDLPSLEIKLYESEELPYFMMSIKDNLFRYVTLVIVFNIEQMQATTFINMSLVNVANCWIISNVAYIFSSTFDDHDQIDHINVYSLSLENRPSREELKSPVLLYHFPWRGSYDGVHSKHQTIAFKDQEVTNKVHILSVSETEVNDLQVFLDIDYDFTILNVVGPDVLTIQSLGKNKNISSFKVTKEGEGVAVKIIDWSKIFSDDKTQYVDPFPMLSSLNLSKLVFYNKGGHANDCLAVFHF